MRGHPDTGLRRLRSRHGSAAEAGGQVGAGIVSSARARHPMNASRIEDSGAPMRKLVTGTRCRTVTADPEEASSAMRPLSDLHLHEQILLLILRDRKGTPASGANHHIHALGGAVLAELALVGHVGIDGRESALVEAVRGVDPPRDEILAEALALVRARERRRRAAKWVLHFSALDGLHERTAAGLCRRGILRRADSRLLGPRDGLRHRDPSGNPHRRCRHPGGGARSRRRRGQTRLRAGAQGRDPSSRLVGGRRGLASRPRVGHIGAEVARDVPRRRGRAAVV